MDNVCGKCVSFKNNVCVNPNGLGGKELSPTDYCSRWVKK